MFDFHTHILPGIDDGSSSVEESLAMLNEMKHQSIDGVAATPHFYADRTSPKKFFERRKAAWEKLKPYLEPDMPHIRLGAEVRYFEGINQYDGLTQFCIEGTRLLLLEMPPGTWTNRMISTLSDLSQRENIAILLAHIERYFREQKKETWDYLLKCGVKMQISADFIIRRGSRHTAMKLLRERKAHLLGSDCHNITTRKPDMAEAISIIERKKNSEILQRIRHRESLFLQEENMLIQEIDGNMIGGG